MDYYYQNSYLRNVKIPAQLYFIPRLGLKGLDMCARGLHQFGLLLRRRLHVARLQFRTQTGRSHVAGVVMTVAATRNGAVRRHVHALLLDFHARVQRAGGRVGLVGWLRNLELFNVYTYALTHHSPIDACVDVSVPVALDTPFVVIDGDVAGATTNAAVDDVTAARAAAAAFGWATSAMAADGTDCTTGGACCDGGCACGGMGSGNLFSNSASSMSTRLRWKNELGSSLVLSVSFFCALVLSATGSVV